jgi:hypothetical protein
MLQTERGRSKHFISLMSCTRSFADYDGPTFLAAVKVRAEANATADDFPSTAAAAQTLRTQKQSIH